MKSMSSINNNKIIEKNDLKEEDINTSSLSETEDTIVREYRVR